MAPIACLLDLPYVRFHARNNITTGRKKITICPTFNPSLDGNDFARTSVYGVSETNGNPHRLTTPLDPDSGPRSSQTNTEPGRMKSRRSALVSRLVIRGKILRATASNIIWLSWVFLTRTSVNVGPCMSLGYVRRRGGGDESDPGIRLYRDVRKYRRYFEI